MTKSKIQDDEDCFGEAVLCSDRMGYPRWGRKEKLDTLFLGKKVLALSLEAIGDLRKLTPERAAIKAASFKALPGKISRHDREKRRAAVSFLSIRSPKGSYGVSV